MSLPWLGYHRISRIGGRVDTPVSDGEFREKVTAFAERKGWEVELLPVEKDQTGSKLERPILEGAIRRIEARQAAGLIVVRYNRLSRATASDTHLIVERIENGAGGRVHSVEEDYPDTPEGRMARGMAFNVSRMEWERSQLGIRASKKGAVEAGVWPMATVPIGYLCTRKKHGGDGRLHPDPETAPKVVEAYKARIRGGSWTRIADRLGVGFSHAAKIVQNPVYRGEIRLRMSDGEEFINPNAHTPLVDRATWEAAQLDHPRPARRGNSRALLAGLIRCAGCGGAMSPNYDTKGGPNYRCGAQPRTWGRCKSPAIISRKKLDDHVQSVVLPHLAEGQVTARARGDELTAAEQALANAEAERDLYAEVTRVIDGKEAFIAGMRSRQKAVEDAAAELAHAKAHLPAIPGTTDIGEMWDTWNTDQRRHVLGGALAGVLVWKGRGSAIDRVRIIAHGFDIPVGPVVWEADLEGEIRPLVLE
jgi:DNA invertase Pin-like site-specific DNA recombinase